MNGSRRPPEHVVRAARRGAAEGAGEVLRQHIQTPERGFGEDEVRRAYEEDDDRRTVRFPPHLRKLFASIGEDDAERLKKLLLLRPETVAWVDAKNDRELKSLDGAVEFINSSRTAARVLMWVCGTAVAFVGGVVALAKNGVDFFALIRGGK